MLLSFARGARFSTTVRDEIPAILIAGISETLFDRCQEFSGPKWLWQARNCTEGGCHLKKVRTFHARGLKLIAGHNDDGQPWLGSMNNSQRLQTIHFRHEDINQHQIELLGIDQLHAGSTIFRDDDVMTASLEHNSCGRKHGIVVVNHQYIRHGNSSIDRANFLSDRVR
jgi:hypothetical protein